jgi:hypothetical protein
MSGLITIVLFGRSFEIVASEFFLVCPERGMIMSGIYEPYE